MDEQVEQTPLAVPCILHGYADADGKSTISVYDTRMPHWTDELHAVLLQVSGVMARPDVDARFLARSGVKLDRALFPLLTRIGVAGPIGAVELAGLVGRDHSTVSRQLAKLEELGLVERTPSTSDGRIRLLRPSAAGNRMLAEFTRTRRKLMEEYFSDWSTQERTELLRLLKKMVTNKDEPIAEAQGPQKIRSGRHHSRA